MQLQRLFWRGDQCYKWVTMLNWQHGGNLYWFFLVLLQSPKQLQDSRNVYKFELIFIIYKRCLPVMDNINDLITKEINERTDADMDSSVCSWDWKEKTVSVDNGLEWINNQMLGIYFMKSTIFLLLSFPSS